MAQEAETYAEEDRRRREEIELRNQADNLAYTAEKTLRDLGDKVPADMHSEVEAKVKAVRDALQGTDSNAVRSAMTALSEAMQRIGAHVYGQGAPPPRAARKAPARQRKARWKASSGRCRGLPQARSRPR